jgi:hypothetical protein
MKGSAAASRVADYYPAADGLPLAETEIHLMLILNTVACLRHFFRRRDVYVAGNLFLYYEKGKPEKRRAPDIMVVKGVNPRVKRRSFKIWVEKAVPRTVIEFTSQETAAEDLGIKKTIYHLLKIPEYFLFDPLHEYLPQPLLGFRFQRGDYHPMAPAADGSLISNELGLRLHPAGENLELYDRKSGARLLPIDDALRLLDETQEELQKERRRSAELLSALKRLRREKKGKR